MTISQADRIAKAQAMKDIISSGLIYSSKFDIQMQNEGLTNPGICRDSYKKIGKYSENAYKNR